MKNNKLKKVILSAITATMISCSLPFTALAAVQVNPLGENLSTDFIKGVCFLHHARIRTKWY